MDQQHFDSSLIQAAMARAEAVGWRHVTIVEAARQAGLPLDEARARFPMRATVLLRLGMLADQSALVDDGSTGSVRERLFDLLMKRIDVLQQYRGGVVAVMRALPFDPALSVLLSASTLDSMGWIAAAANVETAGVAGRLRVKGLVAVWLQTVRAWSRDESEDLSATMAALDKALDRAEALARMLERPLFGRGGTFAEEIGPVAAPGGDEPMLPPDPAHLA